MSATSVVEPGASGVMTLEGWCVLAMSALFGLFLLGVWWELRRNLRSISAQAQKRERAIARLESERAFRRALAREAASRRVAALRASQEQLARPQVLEAPVMAVAARKEEAAPAFGLESVGRILERLALAAPQNEALEGEVPAFSSARPALNMVRGGKGNSSDEDAEDEGNVAGAATARRSRSGRGKARDGVKSSSIGSNALLASR